MNPLQFKRNSYSTLWLALACTFSMSEASILPKPLGLGRTFQFMGRSNAFDQYADRIFKEADVNQDNSVSLSECYELVLKMYIRVNRQASIPPPTRSTVLKIFQESDENHNRRISRDEFNKLARILGRRAALSLIAHSMITYLAAPAVAEYIVRLYSRKKWLVKTLRPAIPARIEPWVTTKAFWRTVLVMLFVSTLGNFILEIIYSCLDWWNQNPHPRLAKALDDSKNIKLPTIYPLRKARRSR